MKRRCLALEHSISLNNILQAIRHMETKMEFAKADGLGYTTFCPTNLGTTLRASVHVRVPMLSKDPTVLKDICAKYNLQPRGRRAIGL